MISDDFVSEDSDLSMIGRRASSFSGPNFDPALGKWNSLKVLVVGAGGLGCELLHCLALSGFTDVHVVDMDTIELSNLNRQFLFRTCHIGLSKAVVAAQAINERFPWMSVVPHACSIESLPLSFYQTFQIVLLGLDSLHARWWINDVYARMHALHATRLRNASRQRCAMPRGDLDAVQSDEAPVGVLLLDGGTEGMQGSLQRVQFGQTACIECSAGLFVASGSIPVCTIANTPRSLEHCVLFASELLWHRTCPFGRGVSINHDDPQHIEWLRCAAREHALQFGIVSPQSTDPSAAFTLGVVKHVIPSVGFTNALIAGMAVAEAVRVATDWSLGEVGGLTSFCGDRGASCYTIPLERRPDCASCRAPIELVCSAEWTVETFLRNKVVPLVESRRRCGSDGSSEVQVSIQLPGGSLLLRRGPSHPDVAKNAECANAVVLSLIASQLHLDDAVASQQVFLGDVSGGAMGSEVIMFALQFV